MRYLSAIALAFAGLFCVAIWAAPNATAAGNPPSPDQFAATAGSLTQQSAGTWMTTAYVDTGALCASPVTFYLVTVKPYSYTASASPNYVYPSGTSATLQCDTQKYPVTEVMLAFTPSPALPAVPQSASLALTPPQAALAAGVIPVDLPLTVRRQVSTADYVWIPVGCGLLLAALLVGFTMLFGVPEPGGGTAHIHRERFWRMPLYASAAWSFGDSWATNITALTTVVGSVLAASGSIAEVIPGVELGRFGLLIALAGGFTFIAPLLFGWLNYQFRSVDPTTSGVAVISLPSTANALGVKIGIPASGTVTVRGAVPVPEATLPEGAVPDGTIINPDTTLDIPADAVITVSARPDAYHDVPGGAAVPVFALPGTGDIVVTSGRLISVSSELTVPASDVTAPAAVSAGEPEANGSPWPPWASWLDHWLPKAEQGAGPAKVVMPLTIPENTAFEVPGGAKISFLGRAGLTLPQDAVIEAPVADPHRAPRSSTVRRPRDFVIPRTGEAVAAQMWTMLAASCLTVFGIGAEIGIVGWVLGYNLVVAPQWARVCCAVLACVSVVLVLAYGVSAIRALADTREGTALSGPGNSSFML